MLKCVIPSSFIFMILCRSVAAGTTPAQWQQPQPQQSQQKLRSAFTTLPDDPSQRLPSLLESALGVGNGVREERLQKLHAKLSPTWKSLQKDRYGRVGFKSLCYLVHRYFTQTYSFFISGLEPQRASQSVEDIIILTESAPHYVSLLANKASRQGFSVDDAVVMVLLIESLLRESSIQGLSAVYKEHNVSGTVSLGKSAQLIQKYMVRWMLMAQPQVLEAVERDPSMAAATFEDWQGLQDLFTGTLRNFEHFRDLGLEGSSSRSNSRSSSSSLSSGSPMMRSFSMEDAQIVVADISQSFGSFWGTRCMDVKAKLTAMDTGKTGRVKLVKFHRAALDGDWRLSESKEYLRALGALDESSNWHGPRVIIPNYLQAISNCIITTPEYRTCCPNECESHMDYLEEAVGGPSAEPNLLVSLIQNLTAGDEQERLTSSMQQQLLNIAETHGGLVQLHSRLFAQWLHFIFPYECAFPHLKGATQERTPQEYGFEFMATFEELKEHAHSQNVTQNTTSNASTGTAQGMDDWMTAWSHEEELLAERLQAPWENRFGNHIKSPLFLFVAAVLSAMGVWYGKSALQEKTELPMVMSHRGKSHYI